ncbi:cellulose biosynthesis protein BcsC [Novosphingobium sp. 9]|uniref:cellulose biosynthesis protein BcsC n=1 Tax=Novosphingobium sp. 9 TaxID=2025349 RepID=UPI0021B5C762|nr:cellulose biosynthesis protein BcsC [Novosphingobium sp. 9]
MNDCPAPRNRRRARLGLTLLLAGAACSVVPMAPAFAADPAVAALLKQVQYWRSKGREDLAQQALRRARALAPNDPAVKGATNAPAPKPVPAPKPQPAPRAQPVARPAVVRESTPMPAPRQAPAPVRPAPAAPAPVTAANRAGTARVAGFDALDDNDLAKAGAQFQRALDVNAHDGDALGGLGLVRLRQSRFAEAADLLEQASRYGKAAQWSQGLASARFFAGLDDARSLQKQGRLSDAQADAEALVRSGYPQPAPALELLADLYDAQGRHADAADLYAQAANGDKGGAQDENRLQLRAIRSRALAAAANGDDMTAQREFQTGLVADPNDPWIRYEFARYMISRGRVPEAESLLRSLESTGRADSLYAAALIDNELGRVTAADQLIDRIPETQQTPQMRAFALGVKTDAAIVRAQYMAKSGQKAQGIAALQQIGSIPNLPAGKKAAVATALIDLGDTQDALQLAQSTMAGNITEVGDYEGLIGVFTRAGRDDLAQQALQRASQMVGTSPDGQKAYARMNAQLMIGQADRERLSGQYAQAFDTLQSAWNAAPDNVEILAGLARLYQGGNMPGRAAQTWQLYLQKKPGDRDALLGLAETAQAAGDKQLSQQAEDQVLRGFAQDYQVYLTLARVEQARGNQGSAVHMLKEARELYARSAGLGGLSGNNPFATMQGNAGNPFASQQVAMAPAPVNPFALGNGARVPSNGGYAPVQGGYAQGSYGQSGATGYAAPVAYNANAGGNFGGGFGGGSQVPAASAASSGAFGAPSYPTQAPQSFGGGMQAAPMQGNAMQGTAAFTGAEQTAPVGAGYSADPVMAQIQSQIAQLSSDNAPQAEVTTDYRQRAGETGLSKLSAIKGSAKLSTGVLKGRAYVRADATVIDAGRPTGSALARFGYNATAEAEGIVAAEPSALTNAQTQNDSGVAFAAGYESDAAKAEIGTTPIGMGQTKLTFHAEANPKVSQDVRLSAMVERQPVTDSIVSYAGTLDPVTGERWGQVMRTAGGAGFSYDHEGTGVYVQGRYYSFRGDNTPNNSGYEGNVGGYVRAYRDQHSSLTVGLNVNYQSYDKSQNYFTFGNGGYFSPQRFISVGFPINYKYNNDKFDVSASLTPGFQSYSQDESALYPTDVTAQAALEALKAEDNDVRADYDSLSSTGFALSAAGSVYYRVSPNTRIGGEASYNTFGSYDEFRSMLGVRQSFGGSSK